VNDDRAAILRTLIDRAADVDEVASDLSAFPWDSELPFGTCIQRFSDQMEGVVR